MRKSFLCYDIIFCPQIPENLVSTRPFLAVEHCLITLLKISENEGADQKKYIDKLFYFKASET
jgi:hypothetical protein